MEEVGTTSPKVNDSSNRACPHHAVDQDWDLHHVEPP
jgi:hypothetical protein